MVVTLYRVILVSEICSNFFFYTFQNFILQVYYLYEFFFLGEFSSSTKKTDLTSVSELPIMHLYAIMLW